MVPEESEVLKLYKRWSISSKFLKILECTEYWNYCDLVHSIQVVPCGLSNGFSTKGRKNQKPMWKHSLASETTQHAVAMLVPKQLNRAIGFAKGILCPLPPRARRVPPLLKGNLEEEEGDAGTACISLAPSGHPELSHVPLRARPPAGGRVISWARQVVSVGAVWWVPSSSGT